MKIVYLGDSAIFVCESNVSITSEIGYARTNRPQTGPPSKILIFIDLMKIYDELLDNKNMLLNSFSFSFIFQNAQGFTCHISETINMRTGHMEENR